MVPSPSRGVRHRRSPSEVLQPPGLSRHEVGWESRPPRSRPWLQLRRRSECLVVSETRSEPPQGRLSTSGRKADFTGSGHLPGRPEGMSRVRTRRISERTGHLNGAASSCRALPLEPRVVIGLRADLQPGTTWSPTRGPGRDGFASLQNPGPTAPRASAPTRYAYARLMARKRRVTWNLRTVECATPECGTVLSRYRPRGETLCCACRATRPDWPWRPPPGRPPKNVDELA